MLTDSKAFSGFAVDDVPPGGRPGHARLPQARPPAGHVFTDPGGNSLSLLED
jgi:hypothetical protein